MSSPILLFGPILDIWIPVVQIRKSASSVDHAVLVPFSSNRLISSEIKLVLFSLLLEKSSLVVNKHLFPEKLLSFGP